MKSALIVIDVQNDFLPGGALAVPRGHEVVPIACALAPRFRFVVATKDWHPPEHKSFAIHHPGHHPGDIIDLDGFRQTLWPAHCVQHTPGADFAPGLEIGCRIDRVILKGTDPAIDSYSGFADNGHRKKTNLEQALREHRIERIFLCGLATDYCVKFTALDGIALGFEVMLIEDGCRAVDLTPGDGAAAIIEMRTAGVRIVHSRDFEGDPKSN